MSNRILIVEDDQDIKNLLAINLRSSGYRVEETNNGRMAFELAQKEAFDLLILDLMLPEMDGLDICRQLRSLGKTMPILILTAKDAEIDRVLGLEMGADDYLTKPFSIRELQARVKAQLRRVKMLQQPEPAVKEIVHYRDLEICPANRIVKRQGTQIELTSTEFDLLLFLARQPGRVFNRMQLLDQVWGYQHAGYEHTVNSHINRLRMKIEVEPSKPEYVLTVWGVGYKFNDA